MTFYIILAIFIVSILVTLFLVGKKIIEDSPDLPDKIGQLDKKENTDPFRIIIKNRFGKGLWIAQQNIKNNPSKKYVESGGTFSYSIPKEGTNAIRIWAKTGCDEHGDNCETGQSKDCGKNGCQLPFESKVEFTLPLMRDGNHYEGADKAWYNSSNVDGFTIPYRIIPDGPNVKDDKECVDSSCRIPLSECPDSELINGVEMDLRVKNKKGEIVGCLSPCKLLTGSVGQGGLGYSESDPNVVPYCCPTPAKYLKDQKPTADCVPKNGCITSEACINGPLKNSKYVALVKKYCPNTYSFAYDDVQGLHTCPPSTVFIVEFG